MRLENVSIIGMATMDAPHRVSSAVLEYQLAPLLAKYHLQRNIISTLTGINARRFWDPGTQPSEVATACAELALADADIPKEKLGVVVNTSVCKDYVEPSVASLVHGRLGLPSTTMNFDVGNACLAFLNGMEIVGRMIDAGQIEYGIVVDGEGSRHIVETTVKRLVEQSADQMTFWKNFATFTLGSGAAAVILGRADLHPDGHLFRGGVSRAATQYSHLCRGQVDEMHTDSTGLLSAGVALAQETLSVANHELGWDQNKPNLLVLHQVSAVHTTKLIQCLELDDTKVHRIFPEFGNIGPAAIPITLAKAVDAGRVKKGDRVALMGIGSGLNCAMMEVIW